MSRRSSRLQRQMSWIENVVESIKVDGCFSDQLSKVVDGVDTPLTIKEWAEYKPDENNRWKRTSFRINIVSNEYPTKDKPRRDIVILPMYQRVACLYGINGSNIGKSSRSPADNLGLLQDLHLITIEISVVEFEKSSFKFNEASVAAISFLSFAGNWLIAVTHWGILNVSPTETVNISGPEKEELVDFLFSVMRTLHIHLQLKPDKGESIALSTMISLHGVDDVGMTLKFTVKLGYEIWDDIDAFQDKTFSKYIGWKRDTGEHNIRIKTGTKSHCDDIATFPFSVYLSVKEFYNGDFFAVFTKLQNLFHSALENRLSDDNEKWKPAKELVDSGTIILSRIDKYIWPRIRRAARQQFLEGYLYCRMRMVQEYILNIKGVDAAMETNQCKDCSRCIVDPSIGNRINPVFLVRPYHMAEWTKWRCMLPSDYADMAIGILKSLIPKKAHGLVEEQSARMDEFVEVFEALCYWDVDHVLSVAECIVHFVHPGIGTLFYPCRMETEHIQSFLSDVGKISLPELWTDLYMTVCRAGHNGVFWIEKKTRQVMVFDGYENRAEGPDTDNTQLISRSDTVSHWLAMAGLLLRVFRQLEDNEVLLQSEFARTTDASDSDPWQLVSITQRLEDCNTLLITQHDGYSCGPIAVAHLYLSLSPSSTHTLKEKLDDSPYKLLELIEFPKLWENWYYSCTNKGIAAARKDSESISNTVNDANTTIVARGDLNGVRNTDSSQATAVVHQSTEERTNIVTAANGHATNEKSASLATSEAQPAEDTNHPEINLEASNVGGRVVVEERTDIDRDVGLNIITQGLDNPSFTEIATNPSGNQESETAVDNSSMQSIEKEAASEPYSAQGDVDLDQDLLAFAGESAEVITPDLPTDSPEQDEIALIDSADSVLTSVNQMEGTAAASNVPLLKNTIGSWYRTTEHYNSLISNLEL
jgi:hypothetical protein